MHFSWEKFLWILQHSNSWMMFHFNLHHITLILIGYLSNISCSPFPFGLLSSQVSGNGITFSHVELPIPFLQPLVSFHLKLVDGNTASSIMYKDSHLRHFPTHLNSIFFTSNVLSTSSAPTVAISSSSSQQPISVRNLGLLPSMDSAFPALISQECEGKH